MNNLKIIGLAVLVFLAVAVVGFFTLGGNDRQSELAQSEASSAGESDSNQTRIKSAEGYKGQLIAGSTAPYLAFTQADFEKAVSEGKVVFLDFYANWCPICRAESPAIIDGFNELANEDVVGFRVNFKDDETDDFEKKLAEDFKIPYQHTKIILKNNQEVYRSKGETWDKETVLKQLSTI